MRGLRFAASDLLDGGCIDHSFGFGGVKWCCSDHLQGTNVVQPLAAKRLRVILASTREPQMQLLHVFQGNLVEQVIIGLACWSVRLIKAILWQTF